MVVGFIDESSIEVAQVDLDQEGLIPGVNPPLIARVQKDYQRVLEQVDRLRAGRIAMGASSEPVLREFFVGSVSRTILKERRVPVLLAH